LDKADEAVDIQVGELLAVLHFPLGEVAEFAVAFCLQEGFYQAGFSRGDGVRRLAIFLKCLGVFIGFGIERAAMHDDMDFFWGHILKKRFRVFDGFVVVEHKYAFNIAINTPYHG